MSDTDRMRFPGQDAVERQVVKASGDSWVLAASRCPECGDTRFPGRELCVKDLHVCEEVELSSEGVIYEATRVEIAPVGFEAPYWIAYVDFPEGVRVLGPVRHNPRENSDPQHGDTVRYSIEPVRHEPYEVWGPVFSVVQEVEELRRDYPAPKDRE